MVFFSRSNRVPRLTWGWSRVAEASADHGGNARRHSFRTCARDCGQPILSRTLSFDDPAVADEAILPNFASFKSPVDGGNVVDNRFDWSFFRLLTPTLGFDIDGAWVHRIWGNALRSGSDVTSLGLKGLVYRNDLHEMLVSARLGWGIGHSGAQGISANAPNLLQPGIFFGKGFGDLPDGLAWLTAVRYYWRSHTRPPDDREFDKPRN